MRTAVRTQLNKVVYRDVVAPLFFTLLVTLSSAFLDPFLEPGIFQIERPPTEKFLQEPRPMGIFCNQSAPPLCHHPHELETLCPHEPLIFPVVLINPSSYSP